MRNLIKKIPLFLYIYRYLREVYILKRKPIYRHSLGFKFVGTKEMEKGEFEAAETRFFDQLIGKRSCLINIGANYGYYVCRALSFGVPVIAVEASHQNCKILLRNVHENSFDIPFELYWFAACEHSGVASLFGNGTSASLIRGWAGEQRSHFVPANKLDSIKNVPENALIWMDIEGAELSALKGSNELLMREGNIWVIEINISEHQPVGTLINPNLIETFKLLNNYGYNAYSLGDKLVEISLNEIVEIETTQEDILGVHNFIFAQPKVFSSTLRNLFR